MAIVGFSFSKIDAVRNEASKPGQIEISHNVRIDSVNLTKLNVGSGNNDVLKIDFTFIVKNGNYLGHIKLLGDVVNSDTHEIMKENFNGWNLDKKLNDMVNSVVSKFIYSKGIVKSLEISDNLNLPAPIPVVPAGMFDPKK
jgi:hypothetical protein